MKALWLGLFLLWAGMSQSQNWLSLPSATGYVALGDLDVPGSTLTVECLYSSTNPASVDLVSKHASPADVNYLLRQTHAELSTTSGFITTPSACPPDQNTCRHAAMVYDGVNLRFYLNGQLNGQSAFTGLMIQNNHQTLIGNYGCCFSGEQFFGFINEVRIWNVARTQAQIQAFMFTPLPTPSLQPGLQAYYTFNLLTNLQGNPTWNGSVAGTASIGAVNPFCSSLSPLCVILGDRFERFTFTPVLDGLQFDWGWKGETPEYFLLETGTDGQQFQAGPAISSSRSDYSLLLAPTVPTWFRLAAVSANGNANRSNAVLYQPSKTPYEIQLAPHGDYVKVSIPQPTEVKWTIRDITGRELQNGMHHADTDFDIQLPSERMGIFILEVKALGQRKVYRWSH